MPGSYTLELEVFSLLNGSVSDFEIWAEGSQLGSGYTISSDGTSISVSIPYSGSMPSALEFRFNDTNTGTTDQIEIRNARINGRAINSGNYLSTQTLNDGETATVAITDPDFAFAESDPDTIDFTTGATQTFTGTNETYNGCNNTTPQTFDMLGGNDVAYLGTGDDTVSGGAGDDKLFGLGGNDTLYGDIGNDKIDGGDGNDTLYGGDGNDRLFGRAGDDYLSGGDGDDALNGNEGNDFIIGGNGNDRLNGGDGNDNLFGDAGNDILVGGNGNDTLDGGAGADLIYGGAGIDYINGGIGDDILIGNDGDDVINGEDGDDIIWGNTGNDTLNGGAGNDEIYGNEGNDIITAASGTNTIYGGLGSDTITGGSGNDTIYAYSSAVNTQGNSLNYVTNSRINENFTITTGVFSYSDGGFGGTDGANVTVDGNHNLSDGNTANGSLEVDIQRAGGTFTNASGSWDTTYTPTVNMQNVQVSFAYRHIHANQNDAGEDSTVWFEFNGTAYDPLGGNSYISQALGSAGAFDSGWITVTIDLPDLTASTAYTISMGIIHTGATNNNEDATARFDDFVLTTGAEYGASSSATADADVASTDLINAGAGNDTLYGHSGAVTLNGEAGDDIIYSGTVSSETNTNTLNGGDGLDTLYGSSGHDIFLFEAATAYNNIDVIQNFGYSYDQLDLSDLLTNYTDGVDDINDFVTITDAGGNTTFWVDADGTGTGSVLQMVTQVNGVTGMNVDDVVADNVLVIL